MMDEEYGFDLADMERDFTVTGEDESGKNWRRKVDLVILPRVVFAPPRSIPNRRACVFLTKRNFRE